MAIRSWTENNATESSGGMNMVDEVAYIERSIKARAIGYYFLTFYIRLSSI